MINIPNTTAVTWTTPPVSTPVNPVSAVQPVGAAGRDRQAGLGAGQDGPVQQKPGAARAAGPGNRPDEALPAALLPKGEATGQGRATERTPDAATGQENGQGIVREQADQEAEKAFKEKLQSVLTTVWQASAAVVERALGRDSANDAPGPRADMSPDLSVAASALVARRPLPPEPAAGPEVKALPWPVMAQEAADASEVAGKILPPEDVVAYDEKGNTSAAPLEIGSLVDQRV
ncbi:MAG TPA: hypothetical protein PKC60_04370 [Hydrogenophaga sp.]|uniref:hypothetical protein n=1 Tax=Hydrogenophaga sp. TaxID=1904254 RepID=UPI002C592565|nr:hypothetical protein [Hydrogenophaga sp.]HMN92446.1 hypothetical protein [Hydrogenophaga sp.]